MNKKNTSKLKPNSTITAEAFVQKIDALGYFKYTNPKHIAPLKKSHKKAFSKDSAWGCIWDEVSNSSLDYRYHFCDGRELIEIGGLIAILDDLQFIFEKIGLQIIIEDHFEEWDEIQQHFNHWIIINQTQHFIFKNFKGNASTIIVQRLVEILNFELQRQQLEERVYLINCHDDGALIFLDQSLYEYCDKLFANPLWKPLALKQWLKIMS